MSQTPPNWPQQPGGQNPFGDQPQSPFGPGGPYPMQYGPPPTRIEDDPAMRWVLPVGTSIWAIAAGYLGLFSLICFPAPLALMCSVIAIWHLRKNPRLSGWGRAILGLVLGTLGTMGLIAMIAAIASGQ
jgi:hypothetical protein